MKRKYISGAIGFLTILMFCATFIYGENIDPYDDGFQYAYGENVGWINFEPSNGGVTIDSDGNFDGRAWGENIGWINFNSSDLYGYNVKACKVNFRIFARFAQHWLETPCDRLNDWCGGADLYQLGDVDSLDLGLFVDEWLDYCRGDRLL